MPTPAVPQTMRLSFVIPCKDEAASIQELFERIREVVVGNNLGPFEVIFVDDGSADATWSTIQALQARHPEAVASIHHRRNFGKAEALAHGFAQARGAVVFTLDADLQDDPVEIPRFLNKIEEGHDLVSGWKRQRHDPIDKTLPSRLFNLVTRVVSGVHLHDFNCGYKAYRREVLPHLHLYGELHRFIPILADAEGFKIAEIEVQHHARKHGKSHYGASRLVKGFLDLLTVVAITRYLKRPGHFFGGVGIVFGALGVSILTYMSWLKFIEHEGIGQRPLLMLGVLLVMLSVQFITIGVLGELIIRLYYGRPTVDNREL